MSWVLDSSSSLNIGIALDSFFMKLLAKVGESEPLTYKVFFLDFYDSLLKLNIDWTGGNIIINLYCKLNNCILIDYQY